ncbi:MAG: hypothetical protein AMXMBFR53_23280 [Gemmatimonadota bacterium]
MVLSSDPEDGSLEMAIGDLFEDAGLVRAVHAGLPLRLLLRAELWKDGFFDSQRGSGEWRASVVFDPLEQRYRVATGAAGVTELTADSLPAVVEALQAAFVLPLRPLEEGRYYYLGQLEMETLSLTDLDELQRWLRGDLASAVRGERSTGSAVGRGVHRLVVRMLGIPTRRYRLRTETFTFEPRNPS